VTDSNIRHAVANTRAVVSDVHRDISDANNVVPNLRHGVSNTHVVVSNICRNTLENHGNTDSQNPVVITSCALSVTEQPLTAV